MRANLLLLGLAALASGACVGSTLPSSDEVVTGVLEGQITDATGAGVPNPAVAISLLSQPVGGSSRVLSQASFVASEQGRFVVTFQLGDLEPQLALAALTATPPPGRGLATADTVGIEVRLWRGNVAQDSGFVVLVLPPR